MYHDIQSPATEAYRALRLHVLSALPNGRGSCLLVTSPRPGEGKSTTAGNLALALARAGRRVWLVDCNLRHSSLAESFPEVASAGLGAFLQGKAEVDDVVRPTRRPGLWFAPLGADLSGPLELLGDERMARFLTTARTRADVVLLDGPAILPVVDTEVLGSRVDGVLLVVRAGQTDCRVLDDAQHRVQRLGARVVGAVLNAVPPGQDGADAV